MINSCLLKLKYTHSRNWPSVTWPTQVGFLEPLAAITVVDGKFNDFRTFELGQKQSSKTKLFILKTAEKPAPETAQS